MFRPFLGRTAALAIAFAFVAPLFLAPVGAEPDRRPSPFTLSFAPGAMGSDPQSILSGFAGLAEDDPGAPYGFPNDNTLGFTTKGPGLDVWHWDVGGPLTVEVDMGDLVKKDMSGEKDHILELYFDLVGWFWIDGDGVYDPAPGVAPGYGGDDPCPVDPFKLFTVHVNGQKIRTLEGHRTTFCTPGDPEWGRTFEIVRVGSDAPNQVRVPKDIVREGTNTVTIEVHDLVTGPPNNPYHSEASDGFEIYLHALAMELAAPPLVLSHGWSNEWDPDTGPVAWQTTFKTNIKGEFAAHTGQDPWRWASVQGKDGILLNFYDKKQDFRKSARELRANVQAFHAGLGFTGKGWMHGHSMGGLVSRYYLEVLGGNARIDTFAQTGTPNLGSWEAHAYTYGFWMNYEAEDEGYTAKWHWTLPGWPFSCCLKVWHGWRDWWAPGIGAYQYYDGPGHGRDHLADFMIKPASSNPPLSTLNARFPAAGVTYFTVRGDCSIFTSLSCAASGYHWRGDGAVSLGSATMNGAIMHRTIDAFHEDIPAKRNTARWMVRYWGGLDLDNGRPLAVTPSEAYPTAVDTHLHDVPRTMVGAADLHLFPADVAQGPYEHTIPIDATPKAELVVRTVPSEDPLVVSLVAPDGTLHEPDATGPGVTYALRQEVFGRTYAYVVEDPAPGEWTLRIDPVDVLPVEGMPISVAGHLPGAPVELRIVSAERHAPGAHVALFADLRDAGIGLEGAAVIARTFVPDTGEWREIAFSDRGDGLYVASYMAPEEEGITRWTVTASKANVERTLFVDVAVASTVDLRLFSLSGSPTGAWGGDAVTLQATVLSEGARGVQGDATVQFFDGDPAQGGAFLGSVVLPGPLEAGTSRTATLVTTAPTHAMTLHARVDSLDLETDLADNVASAPMPFVPYPRTAATLAGVPGAGDWILGPATATLAPFDGSTPRGETRYVLDGAEEATYSGPVVVTAEGRHALDLWTIAPTGERETTRSVAFGVDLAPPTATLLSPAPGHVHVGSERHANPLGPATFVAGPVEVRIRAADTGAGVERVRLWIDEDPQRALLTTQGDEWSLLWDSTLGSVGWHTLRWRVDDAAGRSVEGELRVYVLVGRTLEVERDPGELRQRLDPGGA